MSEVLPCPFCGKGVTFQPHVGWAHVGELVAPAVERVQQAHGLVVNEWTARDIEAVERGDS